MIATKKQQTGGPAFPGVQRALMIKAEHIGIAEQYDLQSNGMTLRDYFAAKAMHAYLTDSSICPRPEQIAFAYAAYEMADAMLRARGEQGDTA